VENHTYALVGNWRIQDGTKGFSVYSYDMETSHMECIHTILEHVSVGMQYLDEERGIVYVVDERGDSREQTGGGGYVLAIRIDRENGHAELINEASSLLPKPSYVWMDKSRKYLLVVHHLNDYYINKIVRKEDGGYGSEVQYDDGGIVVFRLEEDGSIGEICDVLIVKGERENPDHAVPHQHCILADSTGEIYAVCDKGLDKVFTFRLDRDKGKLCPLSRYPVKDGSAPRYCAFHPGKPFLFVDFEQLPEVHSFQVDMASGELKLVGKAPLILEETVLPDGIVLYAADIIVHPKGTYLYVSIRNADMISVYDIKEDGSLRLKQNISAGGIDPRGLCITPDERYLLVTHVRTADIGSFRIMEDGMLTLTEEGAQAIRPGNIRIMEG